MASSLITVKDEPNSSSSQPSAEQRTGVGPLNSPAAVSNSGSLPASSPVTLVEHDLVDLWRTLKAGKAVSDDADFARFLLSLCMHDDDRPFGSAVKKTQTDIPCAKCSSPLTLVCVKCQPSSLQEQSASKQVPSSEAVSKTIRPTRSSSKKNPRLKQAPLSKTKLAVKQTQPLGPRSRRTRASQLSFKRVASSSDDDTEIEDFSSLEVFTNAEQDSSSHVETVPQGIGSISETVKRELSPDPVLSETIDSDDNWAPDKKSASKANRKNNKKKRYNGEEEKKQHTDTVESSETDPECPKSKSGHPPKQMTVEEFMTGRIQVPLLFPCGKRSSYKRSWNVSHHTCFKCNTVFIAKQEYRAHSKTCTGNADKQTSNNKLDAKSIQLLTEIKERLLWCCPFCSQVFFHEKQRNMHALSHHYTQDKNGVYTCKICSDSFDKFPYVYKHLRLPTGQRPDCSECGFRYLSRCQIKSHAKTHKQDKDNACEVCQDSLKCLTKKEIRAHMKTHKEETRPLSLCPICGKAVLKNSLPSHMVSHSDERPFECSVCHLTFKRKIGLKSHEAMHGTKNFQCETCGAEFYSQHGLNQHRKQHLGLVFQCDECGKQIAKKSNLKHHILRVHRKVKQHTCNLCGASTWSLNELQRHKRSHTGEKPFPCKYCPAKFAREDYLQKHLRIHTGKKPYKCEDCQQSFACGSSLKFHRKRHHSDRTYPCDACDKVLLTQASLDHHKYEAHGGIFPYKNQERDSYKDEVTMDSSLRATTMADTTHAQQHQQREEHLLSENRDMTGFSMLQYPLMSEGYPVTSTIPSFPQENNAPGF